MSEELIEKIKDKYIKGLKYDEIIKEFNITKNQLIYLIQKNNWKRNSNRSSAMKNNHNAKGNKGGSAPKNNKNAVVTGEYENIFTSYFSDEEKTIFQDFNVNNEKQALLDELKILTIRERRMFSRIDNLEKGKDMVINNMSKINYQSSNNNRFNYSTTTTCAEDKIEKIQRIEKSLTRIQEAKAKIITALHKIDINTNRLKLDKEKLKLEKDRRKENDNSDSGLIVEIVDDVYE